MPRSSPAGSSGRAVDPDIDLHVPGQRGEWSTNRWVLPVIAAGGMLGAAARYALELWIPPDVDSFAWATFATNVTGCLLIGVLMVAVVEAEGVHPLLRPFVGVGVLGGYTTFSTYAVQTGTLLRDQHVALAFTYLLGTLLAAMVAVIAGVALARSLARSLGRFRAAP